MALDRDHLVHPVANWRGHEAARGATDPRNPAAAPGVRDAEGRELLDAFAGLWCVNIGYGHEAWWKPRREQMRELPYATGYFGYRAASRAIRLAAKLVEIAPAGLNHVYLTLGGSEAVDAAVRLIVQYYNSTGRPKRKQFIALGAGLPRLLVGQAPGLTALPALPPRLRPAAGGPALHSLRPTLTAAPAAATAQSDHRCLRSRRLRTGRCTRRREQWRRSSARPIQGSGGVIVPPVGWLKAMRDTCTRTRTSCSWPTKVITGFGRTGPMFACEAEGVSPT